MAQQQLIEKLLRQFKEGKIILEETQKDDVRLSNSEETTQNVAADLEHEFNQNTTENYFRIEEERAAAFLAEADADTDWQNSQNPWSDEPVVVAEVHQPGLVSETLSTITVEGESDNTNEGASTSRETTNATTGDRNEEDNSGDKDSGDEGHVVVEKYFKSTTTKDHKKCTVYGYVFDENMRDAYNELWRQVRNGKHKLVVALALSVHPDETCGRIFTEKTDHWHMLVWFDHNKPTDTSFHRALLKHMDKKGKHWTGEVIRIPESMMKYIHCEPRQVQLSYGNTQFKKALDEAYENRHIMKRKIENRDEQNDDKKERWDDDDWYQANGQNPQKLSNYIQAKGCRDVASFLSYMKKHHPEESFGSFIFSPRREQTERIINDDIRRSYAQMSFWEALESRREQIDRIDQRGIQYDAEESRGILKIILKANGIQYQKFVRDVLDWVDKKHPKKNALYLMGPSNAMKSTIANSLKNAVPMVGMQVTSSDFAFGNCINCNIIYSEECRVTQEVVCELKRMWEGADVVLNVKNKDGQLYTRTPILCCSNYTPWEFVPREKQTLLNRLFYCEFGVHDSFKQIVKPLSPLMWKLIKEEMQDDEIDLNNLYY